ncbi:conserved protein of unknown function [Ectopseudomonas oleovorans]|uniref:Uncharacterized protein n=1 Tax=Ectopseudomonas oleovorans TaxID=301 RepID=A0A653BBX5_ECTOL|nr:conserved protein of unknown function [Pseudomonas oleovorans]
MSIIGGVGNYSGVSLSGFRGKQNEQQDEQALVTREVGKTVRTANAESEREFQARQATEEGLGSCRDKGKLGHSPCNILYLNE